MYLSSTNICIRLIVVMMDLFLNRETQEVSNWYSSSEQDNNQLSAGVDICTWCIELRNVPYKSTGIILCISNGYLFCDIHRCLWNHFCHSAGFT